MIALKMLYVTAKTVKSLRVSRRGIKLGLGLDTCISCRMDAMRRRAVLHRSEVYS